MKACEKGVATETSDLDLSPNICIVPPFRVNCFALSEHVATNLKWPRTFWPMLLQCVFLGLTQESYSSISVVESLNYEKVKIAVLGVFELVY